MDSFTYLNFDLLIQREATGYRAYVIDSPAGQASVNFVIPFSEEKLENYLLKIGRPRRGGTRSFNSPEVEAAKSFGDSLFNAIFKDEVRGCLRSSLDQATDRGEGLRIRLRLTDVPELADLPWEFLYDGRNNRFLALSTQTPLVRFLDLPERIGPLSVKPPLRILVMISSPTDYPALDVEQEWLNLRKALGGLERRGLVRLERVEKATTRTLQLQLRHGQYHVFHFIGHGGFDKQTQDGVLIFENSQKLGRRINGESLATILYDHRPMRLAVLNACEGARGAINDPFAGVAQSLVQQRMPGVIAMQFEITDQAAISFAQEFYRAIAENFPVDAALAEARKIIYGQGNCLEWATPVLYLRSPQGRIFDVGRLNDAERKVLQQIASLYRDAQLAADKGAWEIAIQKLEAVLELDPTQSDIAAKLEQAEEYQYLMALYADGLEHYQAGRRHEALQCFLKIREVKSDYKDVNRLVTQLEDQLAREEKIANVWRAAQSAIEKQDWNRAQNELLNLISLDPADEKAKAELTQAQQQLELIKLYDEGRKSYASEKWSEALKTFTAIHDQAGEYKDVINLLAQTERRIEGERQELEKRAQIAALHDRAEQARRESNWPLVIDTLRQILSVTPNDEKALTHLRQAEKQCETATIYATGREHYEQGRWEQALNCFYQVKNATDSYKDIPDLITQTQNKIRAGEVAHLYREAEAAIGRENWDQAEEKLRSLLTIDPSQAAAASRLDDISQQRKLVSIYEEARRLYAANRWEEALKILNHIRELKRDYKDVATLAEQSKAEIGKKEASNIYQRALAAMHDEDWDSAVKDLGLALTLDADNPEYHSQLKQSQQQQKLLQTYNEGLRHYQAGHWSKAQKCFTQALKTQSNYKDAARLSAEVKNIIEGIAASKLVKYCPVCATEYEVNENFCEIDGAKLERKRRLFSFFTKDKLLSFISKYKSSFTNKNSLVAVSLLAVTVTLLVTIYLINLVSKTEWASRGTGTESTSAQANLSDKNVDASAQPLLKKVSFQAAQFDENGSPVAPVTKEAICFDEDLGNGVTLRMVKIEGGQFLMGSLPEEQYSTKNERRAHPVTVPSFYIGQFEITRAQWNAVESMQPVHNDLRKDPSEPTVSDQQFQSEAANLPVSQVTWYEAVEFCDRLTRLAGNKRFYRLPSEAEWEYACRAHTETPYAFGRTITLESVNYSGQDFYHWQVKGEPKGGPTPVGHFNLANQFGLFDMHGNLWEWCRDQWHDNYDGAPDNGKAWEDIEDSPMVGRVLRGGSYEYPKNACRSATRYTQIPTLDKGGNIGFRVVCNF